MSLFSSARERRLWLWTLVVIASIFATLGLSGRLAEALGDDSVAAVAFGLAILMVGATILTQGFQSRPRGAEIAVGLGVAAIALTLLLRLTLSERTHLIEYGVLAVFIRAALVERTEQGRQVRRLSLVTVLATTAIGLVDESIQLALPERVFDLQDILFNTCAAAIAVAASGTVDWARRRTRGNARAGSGG